MSEFVPMDMAHMADTNAYKAFALARLKELPREEVLMDMMWHMSHAIPTPRLFSKDAMIAHEIKNNHEFYAAITCFETLLAETKDNPLNLQKPFVARKGGLTTIKSYAEKIDNRHPQLGEFFKESLAQYDIEEISQQFKLEQMAETSVEISAPEPKPEEKPVEVKTAFSQNVVANPTSTSAQLSADQWEDLYAKTGRYGFD